MEDKFVSPLDYHDIRRETRHEAFPGDTTGYPELSSGYTDVASL